MRVRPIGSPAGRSGEGGRGGAVNVPAVQLEQESGATNRTRLDAEGDFAAMAQALASRIGD